jgi:hypothetical protein
MPVPDSSGLRWTASWTSWRTRKGWWVIECPPCAAGIAAALVFEEADTMAVMTVGSRGLSKRILRFSGNGALHLRVIPSVPGMRPDPRPLFSQATPGFARTRMLAKLGRLSARGLLPRQALASLDGAVIDEVWRVYDGCLSRGHSGRADPTAIAEDMSLRSDALAALAADEDARLRAVRGPA